MKAVVLSATGGDPLEVEAADDVMYEIIKSAVGGWIEIAPTPGAPFVMYVNEEGKIEGLPFNARADRLANRYRTWSDPLMGNAVLVGLPDDDGEDTPFTLFDFAGLMD